MMQLMFDRVLKITLIKKGIRQGVIQKVRSSCKEGGGERGSLKSELKRTGGEWD